jgi:F420-dependent oxidoreductase-like protein
MRIGIFFGGPPDVDGQLDAIAGYERDGFDSVFLGTYVGADAMTVAALAGRATSRVELGTSIVPTYMRHPVAMAMQALTTQAAADGRFTLGIGPSHAPMVENMLGLSYHRPAVNTREYLTILLQIIRDGRSSFSGEFFRVNATVSVPVPKPPSVLISALAPAMLKTAGELADGTITWMVGLKTLETHVVPRITRAAQAAGRPRPRIVVGLPVAVVDDVAAAREKAARSFQVYGALPNYRRMLDIEGAGGPADVAIVGNEAEVERQLRALAAAGATDYLAGMFPVGEDSKASLARTQALLAGLVGRIP